MQIWLSFSNWEADMAVETGELFDSLRLRALR
jgi:hypothetical protein